MELELRNFEFEVSYKTIKSKNLYTIFTMLTLVVLLIYWNHNDPGLWQGCESKYRV